MNDDHLRRLLPPERSLPADRRRQMEGRLMARIGEEETRDRTRFRILAGVATAVLAVATVAAAVVINRDDDPERVDTRPAQTSENTTTTTAGTTTPTTGRAPSTSGSTGVEPPPTSSPGAAGGAVDGAGCTNADSPGIPADANSGEVADVDGDGRPDTLWLAPTGDVAGRPMGIVTAAGGRVETRVESAAPIPLSVLVVDVDLTPPVELLVSDGRSVQLWAFADCALARVTDPDGAPYTFDLGQRIGTGSGVGCAGPGDDRRLVGLNIVGDDGTAVRWERTTITRDGLVADEGETESGTFTRPDDDARIELLNGVSCGDLTLADDGINQPGIQPGG